MRTVDLSPFRRSTVGFDRLFDLLENVPSYQPADSYPPFDLEREGEDHFRVTLAVAGFQENEIDITAQQNLLIVSGRKPERDERAFIHKGIATRSFERRFVLGDYVQVKGAELKDGLLSIELVREIPDEMKPRKIKIESGATVSRLTASRRTSPGDEATEHQAAAA